MSGRSKRILEGLSPHRASLSCGYGRPDHGFLTDSLSSVTGQHVAGAQSFIRREDFAKMSRGP